MVRQKIRWLIVHFEFYDPSDDSSTNNNNNNFKNEEISRNKNESITGVDLNKALRDCISESFGSVGVGSTQETKVQYYDSHVQIAMIKTLRECAPTVRAAITILHAINHLKILTSATILSVHGSGRTAKYNAVREIRKRHESSIWNILEEHYHQNHSLLNTKSNKMISTKIIKMVDNDNIEEKKRRSQKEKQVRRFHMKQKRKLFQELLAKNQSRFLCQIKEIQNLN